MKKNLNETSTRLQIFESPHQQAIWNPGPLLTYGDLKRPNPPTTEAIEKAQFVDKTYVWAGHN